jgi:hypothetical protein
LLGRKRRAYLTHIGCYSDGVRLVATGGVNCCKWSEKIEGAAHPGRCAQLGCPIQRFSGADSCKEILPGLVMKRQWQWRGALIFCSLSFAGVISRERHGLRPGLLSARKGHAHAQLGMCANKIIRTYDLIRNLIGKRMILLGGTWGGPLRTPLGPQRTDASTNGSQGPGQIRA